MNSYYSKAVEEQIALLEWTKSKGTRLYPHLDGTAQKAGVDIIREGLEFGETYYWDRSLNPLLESVSEMPNWTLTADAVPQPQGFVWFDTPLPLPMDVDPYQSWERRTVINQIDRDSQESERLLLEILPAGEFPEIWSTLSESYQEAQDQLAGTDMPPVMKESFEVAFETLDTLSVHMQIATKWIELQNKTDLLHRISKERFARITQEWEPVAKRIEQAVGKLANFLDLYQERRDLQAMSWTMFTTEPTGQLGLGIMFYASDKIYRGGRPVPALLNLWKFNQNLNDNLESIRETSENPNDGIVERPDRLTMCTRYAAAFFAFVRQEIITSTAERPTRAARHRIEHWRPDPLVRVIRLRRVHQRNKDAEHEHREWSVQWMVRGFWRNQWYPSLGRHQAKWIAPFIKGPEGKPLKSPRAKVFAVVR